MKVLTWLKDYWYIPLLVLVVIALVVLWIMSGARGPSPLQTLTGELDAIESGRKAREDAIKSGNDVAVKAVKEKYGAKMEALDASDKAKVAELERDPVALAKFLERATRG